MTCVNDPIEIESNLFYQLLVIYFTNELHSVEFFFFPISNQLEVGLKDTHKLL